VQCVQEGVGQEGIGVVGPEQTIPGRLANLVERRNDMRAIIQNYFRTKEDAS
jgi:hypothetical protein